MSMSLIESTIFLLILNLVCYAALFLCSCGLYFYLSLFCSCSFDTHTTRKLFCTDMVQTRIRILSLNYQLVKLTVSDHWNEKTQLYFVVLNADHKCGRVIEAVSIVTSIFIL